MIVWRKVTKNNLLEKLVKNHLLRSFCYSSVVGQLKSNQPSITKAQQPYIETSIAETITEELINKFAKVTGDTNPLHINEEYASKSIFEQRISHGMLPMGLIEWYFSQIHHEKMAIKSMEIKFMKPIYLEEEVVIDIKVYDVYESNEIPTNELTENDDEESQKEQKNQVKFSAQIWKLPNNDNQTKPKESTHLKKTSEFQKSFTPDSNKEDQIKNSKNNNEEERIVVTVIEGIVEKLNCL